MFKALIPFSFAHRVGDRMVVSSQDVIDVSARTLYTAILATEPDSPEALHTASWFLPDQGDLARARTTLANAKQE